SEPKSELQHVPSLLRVTPLCDFIEPRRCELRSPQALRIFRGEELRDDTARPNQLAFRGLEARPVVRRMNRQQPGHTFHHDTAHLIERLPDKRDAPAVSPASPRQCCRLGPDPFGAGTSLSRAATAKNQPSAPWAALCITGRWQLIIARPGLPIPH